MTSIDLLIHRAPTRSSRSEGRGSVAAETAPVAEGAHLLDLDLAGQRCTLALDAENAAYLLRDVAAALVPVLEGRATKAQVVAHDTPWELCFVPGDGVLLVSVFRGGPGPEVGVPNRPVALGDFLAALRRAAAPLPPPRRRARRPPRHTPNKRPAPPPGRPGGPLPRWSSRRAAPAPSATTRSP